MPLAQIIISIYIFITCVGIFGNLAFGYKLCTSRVPRNPLLVGLMVSDLSVCAVSCPVKTYRYLYRSPTSTLTNVIFLDFFESLPVSSATLSMMCVAMDRYCVVKKFQPINRRITRKKTLPYIVALIWIVASFVVLSEAVSIHKSFSCYTMVLLVKLVLINILPTLTVLVSHIILHSNLTAVSLTARARHGELPLPMPILQTKKLENQKSHVIIVTGVSSKDEMEATDATAVPEGTALKTLKNRKRLGYFMLLMAMFFFFLWMPDTICELIDLISEDGVSPGLLQFAQSFGLLHSGISPFLSLASMDRNWTKGVFSMCKQLHILKEHKSPSSTNEDALGPFNPKFVKPNVKVQYNRRSSSVFIY